MVDEKYTLRLALFALLDTQTDGHCGWLQRVVVGDQQVNAILLHCNGDPNFLGLVIGVHKCALTNSDGQKCVG